MTPEIIDAAIIEAERFIERAREARAALNWVEFKNVSGGFYENSDTRRSAAMKRASMDLTRALVAIRKPDA